MHDLYAVDVETTYTKERSLTRLSMQAYLHDPETELVGVAVAGPGSDQLWWYPRGEGFAIPPGATVVAYNAQFDALALTRFGLAPKDVRWLDAMALVRMFLTPVLPKLGLAEVARHYGWAKRTMPPFIGKRVADLSVVDMNLIGRYAVQDAVLARDIARKILPFVDAKELDLIDLNVRRVCEPQLQLDRATLEQIIEKEEKDVADTLAAAGVSINDVRSRTRYAALLEQRGVVIPTKTSARTGQPTLALARTDGWLAELAEGHTDPVVRALARARLRASSNIHRTRAERLLEASRHTTWLSVPLRYFGAHTGRFSGADGLNLQNLPRGSDLRRAIVAPPGKLVVAADLAQIEARIAAWVAQQTDLLDAFARKEDVYSRFATTLFGRPITKADEHERRVGKIAVLGLGYGMGAAKFVAYASQSGVAVDDSEAQRIVGLWRQLHPRIVETWYTLSAWLEKRQRDVRLPGVYSAGYGRLQLPRYLLIYYKLHVVDGQPTYLSRGQPMRTYGAKVFENIVQALARTVLTDAELRLAARGLRAALSAHDELVFVVDEDKLEAASAIITEEMTRQPDWATFLEQPYPIPLAVEIGHGRTYADCK